MPSSSNSSTSGTLLWNTFLGGSNDDNGYAITVDASGNLYVTGDSLATWGLPVFPFSTSRDAFAARLDGSGALVWNAFLGGSDSDTGRAIAVDSTGNIFVVGKSSATSGSPVRPYSANIDTFVAKVFQERPLCGRRATPPGISTATGPTSWRSTSAPRAPGCGTTGPGRSSPPSTPRACSRPGWRGDSPTRSWPTSVPWASGNGAAASGPS